MEIYFPFLSPKDTNAQLFVNNDRNRYQFPQLINIEMTKKGDIIAVYSICFFKKIYIYIIQLK